MFNIKYLLLYLLIYGNNIVENANSSEGDRSSTLPGAGSTDSGNKTGIELSIKATAATNEFDHKKDGKTVTYTAKDNYGFKLVKQKNTEIWKAKDESEYANKVVLEGKGKKDKKVTIYLPNNTTRVFNRVGKGKPWSEVTQESRQTTGQPASGTNSSGSTDQTSGGDRSGGTGTGGGTETGKGGRGTGGGSTHTSGGGTGTGSGTTPKTGGGTNSSSGGGNETSGGGTGTGGGETHTGGGGQGGGGGTPANQGNDTEQTKTPENTAQELQPSDYPQDIKVFKANPNDAANTVELNTNEYKVKKDGDNDYIYEFNNGVNCTLLKRDDKEVWKFDSSKNSGKYPKSMTVMKETVFMDFDGSKEVYSKAGNEWYLNKPVTNKLNDGKTGGQ